MSYHTVYLFPFAGKTTAAQARILAQKKLLQPWVGLTKTALSVEELHKEINTKYTALTGPLSSNVNILTLEPWTDKSFILRLEHIMEKEDDADLSDPVEIDLKVNKLTQYFGTNKYKRL